MEITESYYLVLSALLFTIGGVGLLVRRNPLIMFMCVELMLNAVNLTFVVVENPPSDIIIGLIAILSMRTVLYFENLMVSIPFGPSAACPSPPILNSAAWKATATANPVKMKLVA